LGELQDIIIDALIKYQKRRNELPSVDFTIQRTSRLLWGHRSRGVARGLFFYVTRVWGMMRVGNRQMSRSYIGFCPMLRGSAWRCRGRCRKVQIRDISLAAIFMCLAARAASPTRFLLHILTGQISLEMRYTIPLTAADWLGYFERCHKVFGSRLCAVAS